MDAILINNIYISELLQLIVVQEHRSCSEEKLYNRQENKQHYKDIQ